MEESLQFHTKKYEYDDLGSQHQNFNKYLSGITNDKNDAKAEIYLAKSQINNLEKSLKKPYKELDDLGQYLRRDCIEVIGAKVKDSQQCYKIVMAMAKDMDITVESNDILHHIPALPTPKVRLINPLSSSLEEKRRTNSTLISRKLQVENLAIYQQLRVSSNQIPSYLYVNH